jgi:hypothetical protein
MHYRTDPRTVFHPIPIIARFRQIARFSRASPQAEFRYQHPTKLGKWLKMGPVCQFKE